MGIVVGNGSSGPGVVNGDWEIDYPEQFPTAVSYQANESSEAGIPVVGYASPPEAPAGAAGSTLAVARDANGDAEVFAIGTGGVVYHDWQNRPPAGPAGECWQITPNLPPVCTQPSDTGHPPNTKPPPGKTTIRP